MLLFRAAANWVYPVILKNLFQTKTNRFSPRSSVPLKLLSAQSQPLLCICSYYFLCHSFLVRIHRPQKSSMDYLYLQIWEANPGWRVSGDLQSYRLLKVGTAGRPDQAAHSFIQPGFERTTSPDNLFCWLNVLPGIVFPSTWSKHLYFQSVLVASFLPAPPVQRAWLLLFGHFPPQPGSPSKESLLQVEPLCSPPQVPLQASAPASDRLGDLNSTLNSPHVWFFSSEAKWINKASHH